MRHLLLDGKEAFEFGGSCDTCPFFFQRMEGANETLSPGAVVSNALRAGLKQLEPELLETLGGVVPAGDYRACLFDLRPALVWPGDDADYFRHEQVELWGVDSFWGLPHNPRTPYYRGSDIAIAPDERLFEFVVPMVPPRWLDAERVAHYRGGEGGGTALAIGILDVRAPEGWAGDAGPYVPEHRVEPEIGRHWCLAHYLLDGHHKVYAASLDGRPIRVLTLLAVHEGISTQDEVESALAALAGGAP